MRQTTSLILIAALWLHGQLYAQGQQQLLISQKIASGGGPITFVQAKSAENSANAATAATGTFSSTTGNLIFVFGRTASGGAGTCGVSVTASASDTASNTYTVVAYKEPGDNVGCGVVLYAKNITGHASNVVTVTWNASATYTAISIQEWSGLSTTSPLDTSAVGNSGSGTTVTSGTFSTATANEVIIAGAVCNSFSAGFTPDTGYTVPSGALVPSGFVTTEYKIVSSTQSSVTTNFTTTAVTGKDIVVATFK